MKQILGLQCCPTKFRYTRSVTCGFQFFNFVFDLFFNIKRPNPIKGPSRFFKNQGNLNPGQKKFLFSRDYVKSLYFFSNVKRTSLEVLLEISTHDIWLAPPKVTAYSQETFTIPGIETNNIC